MYFMGATDECSYIHWTTVVSQIFREGAMEAKLLHWLLPFANQPVSILFLAPPNLINLINKLLSTCTQILYLYFIY